MEFFGEFVNWLQQTLGPAAFAGMRLGLIVGPLSGMLIWPFFGQNTDRVLSWGLAGLLGGAFIGGLTRVTLVMSGMRLLFSAQPETGTTMFLQVLYAVGIGALVGLTGVLLVTELQRATIGALAGIPVGIGLGILSTFAMDFLPPLPAIWRPFLSGTVIVAGVILSAVLLEDAFT